MLVNDHSSSPQDPGPGRKRPDVSVRRVAAVLLALLLSIPAIAFAIGTPPEPPARSGLYARNPLPENVPIDAAALRNRKKNDPWYIVTLKDDGTDPRELATKAGKIGPRPPIGFVYRTALNGFSTRLNDGQLRLLRRDPSVLSVTPNYEIEAYDQTIPPGISRIEAAPASKNAEAKIDGVDERVNVGVAVIDSAVDAAHPDLNVASVYDCTGETTIVPGEHGTHVAGTIGALDNGYGVVGVAPGAPIYSYKVFPNGGGVASWDNVICALNRIALNPSQTPVVNMSLGADIGSPADDGNCGFTTYDPMHRAICNVVSKGVTIVVAAGNDCANASTHIPAGYPEVITVAAFFDYNGNPNTSGWLLNGECDSTVISAPDEAVTSFSNWGPPVDIIAPGGAIYSTMPGNSYGYMSGTSMASPHVAGAAALYIAKNGAVGPAAVKAGLVNARERKTLSTVWTTGGKPSTMNQGIVNVNDAGPWGSVVPTLPPSPTPVPTATPIPVPTDTSPPTVKITSPKKNAKVSAPVTIKIAASDGGSGVASVEVQKCTGRTCKRIGSDASAPYSIRKKLKPGDYVIRAVAVDRAGNQKTSAKVPFTVQEPKNRAIPSPVSGAGRITP